MKIFGLVLSTITFSFLQWSLCIPFSLADGGWAFFWWLFLVGEGFFIAQIFSKEKEVAIGVWMISSLLILLCIIGYGFFGGTSLLHSQAFYSQLGTPEERDFNKDFDIMDETQVPTIDKEMAEKLADKILGVDTALGSQCVVGDFTRQAVKGKLVFVAPLLHTGYWKYRSNPEGTAGYIVVSANHAEDVKIVRAVNQKSVNLKYQSAAFFKEDLERHIRNSVGNVLFGDFSFELDDNEWPYWTVSEYKNTIGWTGEEASGLIVVNAVSGEIKRYPLKDVPSWVDRVQPKTFFLEQLQNYGELVHGVFNWSDKDKLKIADSDAAIIYNQGRCFYFVGMTSVGKDKSTVGFVTCDTKTKKTFFYKMNGAQESSAQRSAEGKVQNYGYTATYPLPVNIDGQPSYFVALKDKEGINKQYAFVNIKEYSMVGAGESVREAKMNYIKSLKGVGNSVLFATNSKTTDFEGKVSKISSAVQSGNTYYYLLLEGHENQIFIASIDLSTELPLTTMGDTVKIRFEDDKSDTINVTFFDNLQINPPKDQEQKILEHKDEKVQ